MNIKKKRVLKRNDYRLLPNGAKMPSGNVIIVEPNLDLIIHYKDGTRRWIKNDFDAYPYDFARAE